jgi:antitoxin ChpS
MHTTRLRKVGGSVMLAVPPALLEVLGVQSGDRIDILVERGRLIAKPQKPRRYTLDELLSHCRGRATRNKQERNWVSGPSVGDELL